MVLKDDKIIEGPVSLRGDVVVVRQGSLDRPFSKSQVQFVADSKDDVYRFMLAKVPADDTAARLGVARWCMFAGLREQGRVIYVCTNGVFMRKKMRDYLAAVYSPEFEPHSLQPFP